MIGCAVSSPAAEISVFAASSLTDALKEIGGDYEKQTGDRIAFNFAASNTLARQIEEGAPTDIFFSADEPQMERLEKNGHIIAQTRRTLLSNTLVLIAPVDSQLKISSPAELAPAISRVAFADPNIVPVGVYATRLPHPAGRWDAMSQSHSGGKRPRRARGGRIRQCGRRIRLCDRRAYFEKVKIIFSVGADEEPRISYPAG